LQRNKFSEKIDTNPNGDICYPDIILSSRVDDNQEEEIWEVIRLLKIGNSFVPYFHSFITESEEKGLISERKILSKSRKDLKSEGWSV